MRVCIVRIVTKLLLMSSLILGMVAASHIQHAQAAPNPRYASIVIDARTGAILRQRNADKLLHPASLTKMMTLFMTFEAIEDGRLHFNQRLPVSKRATWQEPSKLGLKEGETITVRNAILSLVTKSANDVAVVLAEALAGSESRFAEMMTRRAHSLGMRRTIFKNASGLHHRRQVSTARDIAILSRSLMQHFPHHYHFFSTQSFSYNGVTYRNHNKLMKSYRGMDGLKTGYIRAAGFNLAASAVRDNRRLIGVVFGGRSSRSRNAHMREILDEAFNNLNANPATIIVHSKTPPKPSSKPESIRRMAMNMNYNDQMFGEGDTDIEATARLQTGLLAMNALTGQKRSLASISPQNDRRWSIQVGAFKSRAASDDAIIKAQKRLGYLNEGTQTLISPIKTSQGLIFRARISGLDARSATHACKILDDCLVITAR